MRSAARKPNTPAFNQLEFCFEPVLSLPSCEQLRERAIALLQELNVPILVRKIQVQWNARMRTAVGRADFARSLIVLNPALQKFGYDEIERTLRHELAHLLAQFRARRRIAPHGEQWRQACRDLGISGEVACHKLPLPGRQFLRRFVYRCAHCDREFPRVHRIRRASACLDCCRRFSDGNYDEQFRLRLVKQRPARKFPGASFNNIPL